MLELLSTTPTLTNSASLLTALRLAHDIYRDRGAAPSVVPILTDRGQGVTLRAWRDPSTNETVLEIVDSAAAEVPRPTATVDGWPAALEIADSAAAEVPRPTATVDGWPAALEIADSAAAEVPRETH